MTTLTVLMFASLGMLGEVVVLTVCFTMILCYFCVVLAGVSRLLVLTVLVVGAQFITMC